MIEKLGKFDIKQQLGQGGMGVVYRTWDSRMERWVALKTIAQDKAARADFIKRFRREALSAGRLDHPNIVTIYEFDEQDEVCYIAMQFLDGCDLETLLCSPAWEKEYTVFRRLEILIQICHGLAYAHRNGVIHRDIKPANIMVLPDGTPKLVDFGIARIGDATSGTQNMLLGTAPYMSPEQVEGKVVDERVDIFAVGVIGYRMFTGHFPFEAPNLSSILYKIIHEPPPPLTTWLSDYPQGLEQILFTALAKDRNERYTHMEEMAFELQRLLNSLNVNLVSTYLEDARRLLMLHDYAKAKNLVRKVLELEPSNPAATGMWQTVQKSIQQEYAKRKVQNFLNEGIEAYERGDFLRALECFDQGLQLDASHEMLQTYRNLTLRERDKIEQISQSMNAAKEAVQRRNWQAARESLHRVLEISPEKTDALEMLSQAEAELAEIEKRRAVQEFLDRAQVALGERHFAEALSLLDKAQALDPGNAQAERLRGGVLKEQAEAEQHKLRLERMAAVQAALDRSDFTTAQQQVEVGLRAFPHDPVLQQLQLRANQGLEAARRKKQLGEQLETARTLLDQGDLAGATKIYNAAKEREPSDARLAALAQAIAKAEERQDRERQRDADLERARGLIRENRHEEARAVLTEVRDRHGRTAAVQELLTFLSSEIKRLQQEREVQAVLQESAQLVDADSHDKAIQLLKKATRKHKAPAITEEISRITRLATEAEECRQYLSRAAALIEKKQAIEALNLLRDAPDSYRRVARYKELWQAASTAAMGTSTSTQDSIPTSVIPLPPPVSAGGGTAAAPARAPHLPVTAPAPAVRPVSVPGGEKTEPKRERRMPMSLPVAAMIAAALVIAGALGIYISRRPAVEQQAPAAIVGAMGKVRLDVQPWAELVDARDIRTNAVEKLAGQTPVELSLPAGDYVLRVKNPKFGEMAVSVHLEAGAASSIRQRFPAFQAADVVKGYE